MAWKMPMSATLSRALLLPILVALTAATDAPAPSPGEIVAAAPAADWADIAPDQLLVMTLAPDTRGKARRVVIQLLPPPFSAGWMANIRALARAHWYDGLVVVRVQDNYVVQWGDPDGEDARKAKPLPPGLGKVAADDYVVRVAPDGAQDELSALVTKADARARLVRELDRVGGGHDEEGAPIEKGWHERDSYADWVDWLGGWPVAGELDDGTAWPVHCYGMVGVGRGMSPDTGSGAELYAVIGQAPRHLDRNIALAGRVVEGIEHLSSLPRGTGTLGFYEQPAERVAILSVRLASDQPEAERPHLQYLSTESESFAHYAEARANRRDPFFIVPAGGTDVCNLPVPIRRRP
jgi:peptidylprolyl isomerase